MFNLDLHRNNLKSLVQSLKKPFFFYDLDILDRHTSRLSKLPVKLWYAVKANPLSSIIKSINKNRVNFDVASTGELEQVLSHGIESSNILSTGPAKSYEQIKKFIKQGIRIFVVESLNQLLYLKSISESYNCNIKVLLRVQLEWNFNSNNVLGGSETTPFGLLPQEWIKIHEEHNISNFKRIRILGFHSFQWGNILSSKDLDVIWDKVTRDAIELSKKMDISFKVLDLGGGIGINYSRIDSPLPVSSVEQSLNKLKKKFPDKEFWLELGRYAVAECGVYVTRIVDKKKVAGKNLLIFEGGINHIARPTLTKESFPAKVLENSLDINSNDMEKFHCHGPLCTSLDKQGIIKLPSKISIGEHVILFQTGAYGFTESLPFFLCHDLAGEVTYQKNNIKIVRRPQKASTWLR